MALQYGMPQFLLKRTLRLYGTVRAFYEGAGTALWYDDV